MIQIYKEIYISTNDVQPVQQLEKVF